MRSELWRKLIGALPPNLTVLEVARIFRRSPEVMERRLREAGYVYRVTRRGVLIAPWSLEADWRLPNVDIARKFGVTRERVRQVRRKLGLPPVECRGRRREAAHAA